MALKVKGRKAPTPKAGPKKARAKSEAEAIRAAVDEFGRGAKKAGRKAGPTRSYHYKTNKKRERRSPGAALNPFAPTPDNKFRKFVTTLAEDEMPFLMDYWHMRCHHKRQRIQNDHADCAYCGLVREWHDDELTAMEDEWSRYCPDGFDMFDWGDLFTKDRSLWRFIHSEVLAEMSEEVFT